MRFALMSVLFSAASIQAKLEFQPCATTTSDVHRSATALGRYRRSAALPFNSGCGDIDNPVFVTLDASGCSPRSPYKRNSRSQRVSALR